MRFTKILSLLLLISMLLTASVSCTDKGQNSENETQDFAKVTDKPVVTDSKPEVVTPKEGDTVYNIIYALATVPPVLAALDCIASGNETYAMVERGKTYSGIGKIEGFHNVGFDTNVNMPNGFTEKEFLATVETVKQLKGEREDVFFEFYAHDGTALQCAAIAANAGLTADEFHVTMCEDGTGAYVALSTEYVNGKLVNETVDLVYDKYVERYEEAKRLFNGVMSKTDNKLGDEALNYFIARAYALAALPNFTYYLQDEAQIRNILAKNGAGITKLNSAFGIEGYHFITEMKLNLRYQTISDAIAKLSEEQRADYLTLMYGDYYEETYAALTRTEAEGSAVPANKLVFIGGRHSYYPHFASDVQYGIGGLGENEDFPLSYTALPDRYKISLLFPEEADYAAFLAVVNNKENYSLGLTYEEQTEVKKAVFNLYIDYIFTLKFAKERYAQAEYDLIVKGHPREALGAWEQWGDRYKLKLSTGKEYVYDEVLDAALLAFHKEDSVGKYIGTVPYGTAAENLAYLGANITVCGLPSSTYSGLDKDVDVYFIMAETNEPIAGATSQVADRYYAATLTYGNGRTTLYVNSGKMLWDCSLIFKNAELQTKYENLFGVWMYKNHPGYTKLDDQCFPVRK